MDACSSVDAVVRMPVQGTVHVTLGGELAPGHLPQCALGPSVTGHGDSLDIFPHPSKLYPSEGEWARVRRAWGPPAAEYGRCKHGKVDRARHKWRRAQAIAYHGRSSQVGLGEGRPGRARGPASAKEGLVEREG